MGVYLLSIQHMDCMQDTMGVSRSRLPPPARIVSHLTYTHIYIYISLLVQKALSVIIKCLRVYQMFCNRGLTFLVWIAFIQGLTPLPPAPMKDMYYMYYVRYNSVIGFNSCLRHCNGFGIHLDRCSRHKFAALGHSGTFGECPEASGMDPGWIVASFWKSPWNIFFV